MKKIYKTVIGISSFIAAVVLIFLGINIYIKISVRNKILSVEACKDMKADCILVLGAGVWGKRPSFMLEDRLAQGVELYEQNGSNRLLMSGDHGKDNYDEVNVMKQFAIEEGVPSKDIFMDHAGFSTYESMYRAKEVFQVKKLIIVTQEYHLYRALYIAEQLGMEAYGVASDPRKYNGQLKREVREILARGKEFFQVIGKPKPTYLGDSISIKGNGDETNDK